MLTDVHLLRHARFVANTQSASALQDFGVAESTASATACVFFQSATHSAADFGIAAGFGGATNNGGTGACVDAAATGVVVADDALSATEETSDDGEASDVGGACAIVGAIFGALGSRDPLPHATARPIPATEVHTRQGTKARERLEGIAT